MKTYITNLLLEYIFSLIFTREFIVVCSILKIVRTHFAAEGDDEKPLKN